MDGGGSDGGGSDGGGSDSVQEQLAIIDAALARVHALVQQGPSFDYAGVQAALVQDARIRIVGTAPDGGLWFDAGDGPLAVTVIDPTPAGGTTAAAVAPPRALAMHPPTGGSIELPGRATFRAYYALDSSAFPDPTPDLGRMLQARGYTSEAGGLPTVEELRGATDMGVFFIKTHGAVLAAHVINETAPDPYYSLYTSTPYPDAAENAILDANKDWLMRRVVVFDALYRYGWSALNPFETHYAITDVFVSSYMSFASHGVALIEACNSGSSVAAPFDAALIAKHADLVVAWNGYVNGFTADNTMRYVVDRLLGTNDQAAPIETPKQRPFDYGSLASDLATKGLDHTVAGSGMAFLMPSGNAILAPSIRNIDVDEAAQTLTFHGVFGTRGDTVAVAGQSLSITSWAADTIVTSLPAAGGDAVVTVDGRDSNKVQLTDWNGGTFTYAYDASTAGGTLSQKVTWTPHLRADLHAYRTAPGIAPPDRAPITVNNALDSKCHYHASGADVHPSQTTSWAGDGDLTVMVGSASSGCAISMVIDPRAGMTSVPSIVFARAVGGLAVTIDPPGVTIPEDLIPDPSVYTTPATWSVTMTRDASFHFAAGSGTPGPVTITNGSVTGTGQLTWDPIPASSPPAADAAR